jgi:APA family basic amino acid/polyamine antiporter
VPFYPLTPLLFLAISAFAIIYTAAAKPTEALFGALTLLGGLGVYAAVSRGENRRGS